MMKAYLLVFDRTAGTRDEVKACLNDIKEIKTWRTDMSNAFYIISEASAQSLSDSLKQCRPNGRFIITEISDVNRQGWLTSESWYLIKHKTHKPTT